MISDLPSDIIENIHLHMCFLTLCAFSQTCRNFRLDDVHFLHWGEHVYGKQFWKEALTRPTNRVFISIRVELIQLYKFEKMLKENGEIPWTLDQYRVLWEIEKKRALNCSIDHCNFT